MADVEDLCQDVFVRVFADGCRALTRINKPSTITAWLITVAQNHVVSSYRKRFAEEKREIAAVSESQGAYGEVALPDAQLAAAETAAWVREGLASLDPKDKLVLDLYYVRELKYAEIAEILGQNINTVSARLRRAKMKLRKVFEDQSND